MASGCFEGPISQCQVKVLVSYLAAKVNLQLNCI